jgi:hypothetical protein
VFGFFVAKATLLPPVRLQLRLWHNERIARPEDIRARLGGPTYVVFVLVAYGNVYHRYRGVLSRCLGGVPPRYRGAMIGVLNM